MQCCDYLLMAGTSISLLWPSASHRHDICAVSAPTLWTYMQISVQLAVATNFAILSNNYPNVNFNMNCSWKKKQTRSTLGSLKSRTTAETIDRTVSGCQLNRPKNAIARRKWRRIDWNGMCRCVAQTCIRCRRMQRAMVKQCLNSSLVSPALLPCCVCQIAGQLIAFSQVRNDRKWWRHAKPKNDNGNNNKTE